jgi:hypothetical protein
MTLFGNAQVTAALQNGDDLDRLLPGVDDVYGMQRSAGQPVGRGTMATGRSQ